MGSYAKGISAFMGTVMSAILYYVPEVCNTWWPAVVALLTTVGVIAIPNANRSDKARSPMMQKLMDREDKAS